MNTKNKIAIIILLILLLLVPLFWFQHWRSTPVSVSSGDPIIVIVRPGDGFNLFISKLDKAGLINCPFCFKLLVMIKHSRTSLKAGEYAFFRNMSPEDILDKVVGGKVVLYAITIPEGYTLKQIALIMDFYSIASGDKVLEKAYDRVFITRLGVTGPSLEGYCYPETYRFAKGTGAEKILEVMVKHFKTIITPQLMEKINESGMTFSEVITLASIVERESGDFEEKPLVASVFLNRLKKGMRLESDPTVIYGIPDFNGNITKKDLLKKTPFNTYRIKGLPPSPICNPGIDSIKAVLYPAKTSYLYFVSMNNGKHYFSCSLKEHNRAVFRYQKKRR